MTPQQLIDIVDLLTRYISGDVNSTVRPLPAAGGEQTLILCAPTGTGRVLGKGGRTFRALRRVVNAASWRTGVSFRLVIDDPRQPRIGSVNSEEESEVCSEAT